jgi:hypothetical protein
LRSNLAATASERQGQNVSDCSQSCMYQSIKHRTTVRVVENYWVWKTIVRVMSNNEPSRIRLPIADPPPVRNPMRYFIDMGWGT